MTQVQSPKILVHQEPGRIPPGALRGDVAIVIDVLRATTTMAHALAAGCREIIPCGEIDEARAVADCVPPESRLLAGERGGLPIPGFDLGNAPEEFTSDVCRDKTIVMTTSNGTRAILASLEAEHVFVASFVNLSATVEEILVLLGKKDRRHAVHLVCAGNEGKPAEEDSLFAGCLAEQLIQRSWELSRTVAEHSSPELETGGEEQESQAQARFMIQNADSTDDTTEIVNAWRRVRTDSRAYPLWERLRETEGGGLLAEIGRTADIQAAAMVDSRGVVGKLGRKPTRISAV